MFNLIKESPPFKLYQESETKVYKLWRAESKDYSEDWIYLTEEEFKGLSGLFINDKFYDEGGHSEPGGVLKSDKVMTEEDLDQLQRAWAERKEPAHCRTCKGSTFVMIDKCDCCKKNEAFTK